jgi:cytochrome P450
VRDVVEISYNDMDPILRATIAYEANGALDVAVPQTELARLLRETPVVRWEMGVAFFTMDDVLAAGRNPAIVSTNPETGAGFGMGSREPLIPLHIDGDRHRRFRKLLDPLLAPKQVARMEGSIRKLADELIDGFLGDGEVEFHDAFALPLPDTIFLTLFGMPLDDMQFLVAMKDRILKNEGVTMEEREAIGIEAGDRMRERLYQRLAERREEVGFRDDLIGQFTSWEIDGDRLSDDEIVNIMHLFTIAGLDTVTSSLSCLVGWFAQHPDERRRVVAEPSTLPAAIEELMRYESPVPSGGVRFATEDTDVNGVAVRKGEMVYLGWATANLDPATFDHPLDVDFDRTVNRHIAFAAGTHRCLGSHLARLELRAAIDQFHARIPDYWITPGEEPVYECAGVRQVKRLPLSFSRR